MIPRLTLLFIAVLSLVVVPTPELQAQQTDPPFELRFPHDSEATDFINSWRHARSGGRRHQGTDLMAPKMTPVFAIADGVVTVVRASRLAGRYIGIEHADGWESYYMHLNNDWPGTDNGRAPWHMTVARGIEVGGSVRAGQLIGWSGDSGNAENSSPHTHFELHRRGRAVNPYPYLRAAWERDMDREPAAQELEADDFRWLIDGQIYIIV